MIGFDPRSEGLRPWNVVEGRVESLAIPGAVAIDRSYFDRLETTRLGEYAEIGDQKVQVLAITNGIRSFTTTPYVFSSIDRARAYTGTAANKASYFLVRLTPGANVTQVRDRLRAQLTDAEVLTTGEFRNRSSNFWLFGTGAGAALFAGALLGLIVGTVIVAQTLYSSTKDHLNEFATLRAIGSSGKYIHKVIIFQALLSAVIGFCIAAAIGWIVVQATADTALPVVITPLMTAILLVLTVLMCVVSAISAIVKVMRIDPAMVFTR
jgi:putative ABC transport system permease protein